MKILLTSDWSIGNINGVVVSIMNLYNELKKDGHDVRILTLSKKDESYVDGDFYFVRSFGIKFYPDLRATFAINSRILKKLIEWKPDIVHSQCEFFTYYFAYKIAIESSAPLIHTYHTLYEYYTKYVIPSETVGRLIVQNYMRVRLRDCDAIIAPTNKVKKSLENAKVYGKIKVIPTGIDLDKYNKNLPSEELEDLRKSFNIDKNKKIILSLGRVAREKNIDLLLKYIKSSLSHRDDFVFMIVGSGPYIDEIKKLTKELDLENKVIFTGLVKPEEVTKYYRLADIFACASKSETQGLTYIEALANGLVEICLKDDAIDGVIEDGYNGFIFENEEDFSIKCQKLLDDDSLRIKMGENAKKSSTKFSTTAFKDRVFLLYKDVLENFNPNNKRGVTYMTHKIKVTGTVLMKKS